jgi:hypothetical protein
MNTIDELVAFALNQYMDFDMYIWGVATKDNYQKIGFSKETINSSLNSLLSDSWLNDQQKEMIISYLD